MRILCIDANYPGRLGLLAGCLAGQGHDLLFASCHSRKDFSLPGVRRVILRGRREKPSPEKDPGVRLWRQTLASAEAAMAPLRLLNTEFRPDMVLSTLVEGMTFFAGRIFPDAFHAFYALFPGGLESQVRQSLAAVQSLRVLRSHRAYAFSGGEREAFAPRLQPLVELVRPWVDTALLDPASAGPFAPENCAGGWISLRLQELDVRELRAARRLALALLSLRAEIHVFLDCGETGMEKAAWAARLPEDFRSRLHAGGRLSPCQRRDLLRASSLHIIPAAPALTRMARLEAMSSGGLLMASLPGGAEEAQIPGKTMLAFPADLRGQLRAVVQVLDRQEDFLSLRRAAREEILRSFSPETAIPLHAASLMAAYGSFREARASEAQDSPER